jgi:hypothetical protein
MRARLRHPVLILAVLGLTVVSGCGDDKTASTTTPEGTTAPTTTTPATTAGPSDEPQAMLLEASDLGPPWQVGSPINEADLGDLASQIAEPCPGTAMNPTIAGRLAPHDAVQFEPSDGSPMIIMETIVAGDPARLPRDVTAYISSLQACVDAGPIATESPDSVPGTIEYTAITIPELGDQSFAWLATTPEPTQGTWYGRTAIVRVGGTAMTFGLLEALSSTDGTPAVSNDDFIDMVTTAAAKLTA